MSARPTRRTLLAGLVPAAAGLLLAGCGFQPVYMRTATRKPGPAQRGLAAIDVDIIPDRPGQLMRQALQARFGSPGGNSGKYDLAVSFWISGEPIGIQPDNNQTRVRMTGHADWVLRAKAPAHSKLTSGNARALDAINVFDQQYFALDLETEAAQRRIADTLADQVTMQLAIWFRERAATEATG